jgi:predicted RNA-binding protein (virulence factor B family)
MALNPELRVIRVLDASLLDEDNMAIIKEMAAEHDFQVWLEVVQNEPGMGVFIEDGKVKE